MKFVDIEVLNTIQKENLDLFNVLFFNIKRYAEMIMVDTNYVHINSIGFCSGCQSCEKGIYISVSCSYCHIFSGKNEIDRVIRYHIIGKEDGRTDGLYESLMPWLLHYDRDKKLEEIGISGNI